MPRPGRSVSLRLMASLAALLLVAAACSSAGSDSATSADEDPPLDFVADLVGGGQLDANDLAGRDVVLWFWAPW